MKFPIFIKLCTFLSLVIFCLAVYLLPSNPVSPTSKLRRLSEAAPSAAIPEPAVPSPSSKPSPAVAESNIPDSPAVSPGLPTAGPIQHKELAARRVAAGAPDASNPASPDTASPAADIDPDAPLPVPMPAAIVSGDVPAALPLALVEPDPNEKLTDLQQMGRDSLRKGFIDKVGGLNQDPNDPEYLRRWLDATNETDERFKTMFGWEKYRQQQMRAVQEAGGVKAYFKQLAATQRLKK